jgi:thiamine kinase-like enzyme
MSGSNALPDDQTLAAGLGAILGGGVRVLSRELNPYASTFPSEVVTCRWPDCSERRLFCKYGAGPHGDVYGHKGGVSYEAAVYERVLRPLEADVPQLHGVWTEKVTRRTWLVCDYLDESDLLHREPAALAPAARWIGRFHRRSTAHLRRESLPFLNAYSAEYYLGWARRTLRFAEGLHSRFPWLMGLCKRFEEALALLLAPPLSVIHGEYYPGNILLRKGKIYPVDWESAAVAAGEIDIASLTECWSAEIAGACEAGYRQARWPQGPPAEFSRRLAAARLYLAFRWLGQRPDWTTDESVVWRFDELRAAGDQLGLLEKGSRAL